MHNTKVAKRPLSRRRFDPHRNKPDALATCHRVNARMRQTNAEHSHTPDTSPRYVLLKCTSLSACILARHMEPVYNRHTTQDWCIRTDNTAADRHNKAEWKWRSASPDAGHLLTAVAVARTTQLTTLSGSGSARQIAVSAHRQQLSSDRCTLTHMVQASVSYSLYAAEAVRKLVQIFRASANDSVSYNLIGEHWQIINSSNGSSDSQSSHADSRISSCGSHSNVSSLKWYNAARSSPRMNWLPHTKDRRKSITNWRTCQSPGSSRINQRRRILQRNNRAWSSRESGCWCFCEFGTRNYLHRCGIAFWLIAALQGLHQGSGKL